jgi:hypothetical protein
VHALADAEHRPAVEAESAAIDDAKIERPEPHRVCGLSFVVRGFQP